VITNKRIHMFPNLVLLGYYGATRPKEVQTAFA
jgi:hypothetical protein